MNAVIEQIIDRPELVEQLCELTSSMTLALAVSKLQSQQKEIDRLRLANTETICKLEAVTERLEKASRFIQGMDRRLKICETLTNEHQERKS